MSDTGKKKLEQRQKRNRSNKLGRNKTSKGISAKNVASKKQLWGGIIEYHEPAPSVQMERITAAVEVGLGRFEQHRTKLIAVLRNSRNGRHKAEFFDEAKLTSRLNSLAHSFFWQAELKKHTMPAATHKRRADELAKLLARSRTVVEAAMGDDVGGDLCSAWCERSNEPLLSLDRNSDGSIAAVRGPEESFKKAVVGLAGLAAAARHAADQAKRPGRRRPKGTTVLPGGYIEVLAALYREATGRKPGTGSAGPFVRFVSAFLAAVGAANVTDEYVAELAQAARSWAHSHPSEWGPSPFDNQP